MQKSKKNANFCLNFAFFQKNDKKQKKRLTFGQKVSIFDRKYGKPYELQSNKL
jgi:hypothetical protein